MIMISPEHKILFQLLRGEEVSLPVSLDHEKLFKLFRRHKLFAISGPVKELLEGEEKEKWKEIHQQLTLKSLKLTSETVEIIDHFRELGIMAIPLKGPVLASNLYGDVGMRHFNDIDLLVERADLEKTRDALIKIGYSLAYPGEMSQRQEKIYFRYKKDIGLHNKKRRIFIELHYGIYVHELLKKEEEYHLIEATETIRIQNEDVVVLDKESTFIYLVYHGCLHQYFRLFWLRDVAECIKKWDLDHESILQRMKELGLGKMLGISINLVIHYFDVMPPAAYSEFLGAERDQRLINTCHERICGPETETLKLKIARHRFLLGLKPGFKYKWTVLWSIIQRWRIRKFMGGH